MTNSVWRLHDQQVGVVAGRKERRPFVRPVDAALREAARLRAVERADPALRAAARSCVRFCPSARERRDAPVRRVGDDRRPQHRVLLVALEQPDAVVVVDVGVALDLFATRHVLDVLERSLGERLGLLGGEELLVLELRRPLERRERLVRPVALHVGLAVGQARDGLGGRLGARGPGRRCRGRSRGPLRRGRRQHQDHGGEQHRPQQLLHQ